ncbi:MAG: hypothetical protein WBF40_09165, partial [Methyloceanibacter sp.]
CLACSTNVQVLQFTTCGEGVEFAERSWLYFAAVLANAAQQSFPGPAEGSIFPTKVPFPGVALLPLQPPLLPIINDPPVRIELRYDGIRGVR